MSHCITPFRDSDAEEVDSMLYEYNNLKSCFFAECSMQNRSGISSRALAKTSGIMFVARCTQTHHPLGCICVNRQKSISGFSQNIDCYFLHSLCVADANRNSGVGRSLLLAAIEHSGTLPCCLTVHIETNPYEHELASAVVADRRLMLIPFYEHHGFRVIDSNSLYMLMIRSPDIARYRAVALSGLIFGSRLLKS